jgi:hypothetical protein
VLPAAVENRGSFRRNLLLKESSRLALFEREPFWGNRLLGACTQSTGPERRICLSLASVGPDRGGASVRTTAGTCKNLLLTYTGSGLLPLFSSGFRNTRPCRLLRNGPLGGRPCVDAGFPSPPKARTARTGKNPLLTHMGSGLLTPILSGFRNTRPCRPWKIHYPPKRVSALSRPPPDIADGGFFDRGGGGVKTLSLTGRS